MFCLADWNYGIHDPFLEPPEKPYICAHNVIKSHARAFRIYDEEFRPSQNGQMGITLNCDWSEPKNQSDPEHMLAMDRSVNFRVKFILKCLITHTRETNFSFMSSTDGGLIHYSEENILQ